MRTNRVWPVAVQAPLVHLSMPSVWAQAPPQPAPTLRAVEACRVSVTEAGRAASFQGTAVYRVLSDTAGAVAEVRRVKVPQFRSGRRLRSLSSALDIQRGWDDCCGVQRWDNWRIA